MTRREALSALMVGPPALASVAQMTLRPNDVIVLESTEPLSKSNAAKLEAQIRELWPEHQVVALGPGMKLSIVRPEVDGRALAEAIAPHLPHVMHRRAVEANAP